MIGNIRRNIKSTCIIMLLPVLLVFFTGPLSVYSPNAQDFYFDYKDFFFDIALLGAGIYIVSVIILAVLPEKINRLLCMMTFYTGLMCFLQDMFFNIKLAENDGSNIDFSSLKPFTVFNTVFWIGSFIWLAGLYAWNKNKFIKISVYASGFLCILQLVSFTTLFSQALQAYKDRNTSTYDLVGDNQYTLAKDNNVIVFILDSFGSAQLDYGLSENPDLLNALNDFTYYNNADSCYFGTYPSMTHMLTGYDLDFTMTAPEYLENAWTDSESLKFFNTVHDNGFKFMLYSSGGKPVFGNADRLGGYIDNAVKVSRIVDKKAVFNRMTKISIFKYVPYIIKPYFEVPTYKFYYVTSYENNRDVTCGNSTYYDELSEKRLSLYDDVDNAVIIQHLDGTHPPFETNLTGQGEAGLLVTEESLMIILEEYINQLKDLGIYDNSTIIITADHGRMDAFGKGTDPQIIYFIKQKNEHHDSIAVSGRPVSHDDFRATVLSVIGADYSEYGKAVTDYGEDELRIRTIVNRETDGQYKDVPGEADNVYAVYYYEGNKEAALDAVNKEPSEKYGILGW